MKKLKFPKTGWVRTVTPHSADNEFFEFTDPAAGDPDEMTDGEEVAIYELREIRRVKKSVEFQPIAAKRKRAHG